MKVLLDACVLYPTVMREMLLAAAAKGFFTPQWSARILEEWARAAARHGPVQEAQARGEIALTMAAWPGAGVKLRQGLEARLWLPDPADVHVLAAAISGSADVICTLNAKDFPRNILAEEGLSRADPDALLRGFYDADAAGLHDAAQGVLDTANALSGEVWEMRQLLKKARLPRTAKALG